MRPAKILSMFRLVASASNPRPAAGHEPQEFYNMSRQIQIRRGTAAKHETFTGAIGEITMDTTNKTLRVHDGTTPGGVKLARAEDVRGTGVPETADYVIETQLPTAENNYTWYRKYKSGWVEQEGTVSMGKLNDGAAGTVIVQLAITMLSNAYHVTTCPTSTSNFNRLYSNFGNRTESSFNIGIRNIGGTTSEICVIWSACGHAVINQD